MLEEHVWARCAYFFASWCLIWPCSTWKWDSSQQKGVIFCSWEIPRNPQLDENMRILLSRRWSYIFLRVLLGRSCFFSLVPPVLRLLQRINLPTCNLNILKICLNPLLASFSNRTPQGPLEGPQWRVCGSDEGTCILARWFTLSVWDGTSYFRPTARIEKKQKFKRVKTYYCSTVIFRTSWPFVTRYQFDLLNSTSDSIRGTYYW